MPLRSFAESYNAKRHEGEEVRRCTVPVPSGAKSWAWEAISKPMSFGTSSNFAKKIQQQEAMNSGFAYTLIRSDVDEVAADHERPAMPRHVAGIKSRMRALAGAARENQVRGDTGPLAWVDSSRFQVLSGIVMCMNAILIGLETDVDTRLWFYVDQLLLAFFTFELLVRFARHGGHFFRSETDRIWNWFDTCIVVSGVVDEWIFPLLSLHSSRSRHRGHHSAKMGVYFLLMRMLRLLRVVRLFRLVRIVRPLYILAQGVLEALRGMFWVLVFLVMTLYGVAILCTRLIGSGLILPEDYRDDRDLVELVDMFDSVETSMFTLFGALTSWSLLKFVPLFDHMPYLKPMFVVFYVYSAWALLAVLTGIVSENMVAIREQMVKDDEAREELRRTMIAQTLVELFQVADVDRSGTISRQEFEMLIGTPSVVRKIERNANLRVQDLQDLFEWLDRDGSGTISHEEFMKGFTRINEPLRAKTLIKLQERWTQQLQVLQTRAAQTLEQRISEVSTLIAAPLRKVHAITEQMQTMDAHLAGMRGTLIEHDRGMPTHKEVRAVEQRLNAKLSKVLRRLQQVEKAVEETYVPLYATG